ncbi:MAG: hypothetical protein MJZ99_00455 [Bacteroidales bacterium]|nr:hypothetical protein [Bacteroidales bacterium]
MQPIAGPCPRGLAGEGVKKKWQKSVKKGFLFEHREGISFKTGIPLFNEGQITKQDCRASLNHFSFSVAFLAFGRTALIFFLRTILLFQDLGSLGQNARSLTGASRLQEKEMK